MSRLKREQVSGGIALLDAKTDIDDHSGTFGGSNDGDMVPFMGVPMGYYVKPIDDKWTFGLGMYVPFGLITDYESGFQGRYYGDRSEVRVITLQPTISYKITDQLSVGFGPTINRIDGELTSATLNAGTPAATTARSRSRATTPHWATTSACCSRPPQHPLRPDLPLDGRLQAQRRYPDFRHRLRPLLRQRVRRLPEAEDPESVDFSVTHDLNADWTLYAGSTWTRWSRLKDITVNNKGVPALLGARRAPSAPSPRNRTGVTWSHAVGASYKLNPQWTLRAGLAYDQTPTRNEHRSPRIPTDDRKILSLGAAWSPSDD